jgi:hypothetical protein
MGTNSRIKLKIGICTACGKGSMAKELIGKLCRVHYWGEKREGHEIAKKSAQQKERDKEFRPIHDRFMRTHKECMIRQEGCLVKTTELHHGKGKIGDLLFDEQWLVAACLPCHRWAELHPVDAKVLGISFDRLESKNNLQ